MLSIKEICDQTGLTLHTFQSWRRGGSNLLPKPVSVNKGKILFDDSILERIKFIRDQQDAGQSLTDIEAMLEAELADDSKILPSWRVMAADHEIFQDEIKALKDKWESGQCLVEICAALKLDPALSGQPSTFCLPAVGKQAGGLMVYASLISNGLVRFIELYVDLYDDPVVEQTAELPVDDFAMLLYLIGRELAERKQILKTEMIPYLLFRGLDDTGADSAYWRETLEIAPIMNQITEASRQYLVRLKKGDIKIP